MAPEIDAVQVDPEDDPPGRGRRPPPAAREKPAGRTGVTRVVDEGLEADARAALEWMEQFNLADDVKLKVARVGPREWMGRHLQCGHLDTLTEKPDDLENEIRRRWGGGKYQVQLHLRNRGGNWQFGKARTFEIGGNPILPEIETPRAEAVPDRGDSMGERAMGVMERETERARAAAEAALRRADEARADSGRMDMGAIEQIVGPLRDELASARLENQRLSQQLLAAIANPPTDKFRDRILESAVDGDNKRIRDLQDRYEKQVETMREGHASEIRQLRQSHTDDQKRLEDRHDRTVDGMRQSHERQIADMKSSHDRAMADIKAAHEREIHSGLRNADGVAKANDLAHTVRAESLGSQSRRLEAENAQLRIEVAELRARKEKTPGEMVKEFVGLKEGLETLSGGGGEDESPWAKAVEFLSPVAMKIVDKIGGGEGEADVADQEQPQRRRRRPQPQAPAQPQQPQYQLGEAGRNPQDGQIYFYAGNGKWDGPYTDAAAPARHEQIRLAMAARRQQAQQQSKPAQSAQPVVEEALADQPAATPTPTPTIRTLQPANRPAGPPPGEPPTTTQIEGAVLFLESSLGNKTPAENVASTARSLIPGNVLAYIRHVGIEKFLQAIHAARPQSRLLTQVGKTFVRDVAGFLFGG